MSNKKLINKKVKVEIKEFKPKKTVVKSVSYKLTAPSELSKVKLELEGEKLNKSVINREMNRLLRENTLWGRIKKVMRRK